MALETRRHTAAAALRLEYEPVEAGQRTSGAPRTGLRVIGEFSGNEIGVWEMTEGGMRDIEADEVFVVLSGHAEILFEETSETLVIGPGDVVRLSEGERTRWEVSETLRKVYVTPVEDEA